MAEFPAAELNKLKEAFQNLHVLIMAGGSGTRFWPRSRKQKPKQLLALWDDKTLIEHTLNRFKEIVPQENIWIVTTEALAQPTKQVLSTSFPKINFLNEPEPKNTAACIFWGVNEIKKRASDALVAVMPADHFIGDPLSFLQSVARAATHVRGTDALCTLGIKPNRPETGFGYIEKNSEIAAGVYSIKQFVEKPDLRTALRYLESGNYVWNAGMFIFTASAGFVAFQKCMPSLVETFQKNSTIQQTYSAITSADAVSVDYGVMEKASSQGIPVFMVPTDCGWNDVGSFTALEEINCAVRGEVVSVDSACNIIQSDSGIVALFGVNDLVVVREKDVVLVCARDRAQNLKQLYDKVKLRYPEKI